MPSLRPAVSRKPRVPKALRRSEHDEQVALFAWAALAAPKYPELRLLFAIPNAGGFSGGFKANVARVARLKREGVKSGVPDICLPVARGGAHALYVELKATGGKESPAQAEWRHALRLERNCSLLCVGWESARDAILVYLSFAR